MGAFFVLSGLLLAFGAQLYATARVFRISPIGSVLCLFVPGWVIYEARRHGFYQPTISIWSGGLICTLIGTIILS